jgi:hypothetical protein
VRWARCCLLPAVFFFFFNPEFACNLWLQSLYLWLHLLTCTETSRWLNLYRSLTTPLPNEPSDGNDNISACIYGYARVWFRKVLSPYQKDYERLSSEFERWFGSHFNMQCFTMLINHVLAMFHKTIILCRSHWYHRRAWKKRTWSLPRDTTELKHGILNWIEECKVWFTQIGRIVPI